MIYLFIVSNFLRLFHYSFKLGFAKGFFQQSIGFVLIAEEIVDLLQLSVFVFEVVVLLHKLFILLVESEEVFPALNAFADDRFDKGFQTSD